LPTADWTMPVNPLALSVTVGVTTLALTPLVWSVMSVTCEAPGVTAVTLPTRPSPLTTGWSTRMPDELPLSTVIVAYQTVGERPITRDVIGLYADSELEWSRPTSRRSWAFSRWAASAPITSRRRRSRSFLILSRWPRAWIVSSNQP
jgi:hypothetical protein